MGTFGTRRNETSPATTRRLHDLAMPRKAQGPPPPPKISPDVRPDVSNPPDDAGASTRKAKKTKPGLADLVGVKESDRLSVAVQTKRDLPRIAFRPVHALIAILTLTCALCASLTMLIQQAIHYSELQRDRTAYSSVQTVQQEHSQSDNETQERSVESESESMQSVPDPMDGLVDINSAGLAELQTLNGVGPAIAQRIIDYRTQIGRFDSVDQLLEVNGIGAKTLSKFKDQVCAR